MKFLLALKISLFISGCFRVILADDGDEVPIVVLTDSQFVQDGEMVRA